MKRSKRRRRARICLYVVGLIIFLELWSWLMLNHAVSPSRMERFNGLFLKNSTEYGLLPHPYLGWVTSQYLEEQEAYLSHLGKERGNIIYIAALGGSTTASGYPTYTERYLNGKLERVNSSMRAEVFNFGVGGWASSVSLQNYVYVLRYLHPDFVVIHHNVNDLDTNQTTFSQSVIYYPQISSWERTLIKNSGFYRLLKLTYLVSYNPIHYGERVVRSEAVDFPVQARLSSVLNGEGGEPTQFFRYDLTGGELQLPEIPHEFLLTETYESLIKYTRADNSTLIMTTQHLNLSKFAQSETGTYEYAEESKWSRHHNNLFRNLSAKHGITLVDLESKMEQYDYLFTEDGIHFTEEGNRLKGELIGEAIFEILEEISNLTG